MLVVAVVVLLAVVLSGNGSDHDGSWPGHDGNWPGGALASPSGVPGPADPGDAGTRFSAGDADTVVLDGVSGRIQVTADGDAHGVTGTYHRADGQEAHVRTHTTGDSPGTLALTCEDGDGDAEPCAGDIVLTVPAHTGLRLRQTSGETTLDGIGGELNVVTASDRLTATGLRPSRADVEITSGSADLGFSAAPADLAVHASSASTSLRLPTPPDAGEYAVSTAATSANVQVQVPHTDASGADATPGSGGTPGTGNAPAHRISLQVVSGSLAVLPA